MDDSLITIIFCAVGLLFAISFAVLGYVFDYRNSDYYHNNKKRKYRIRKSKEIADKAIENMINNNVTVTTRDKDNG